MLVEAKMSMENVVKEKEASFKGITWGYERELKEKDAKVRELEGELQQMMLKLKDLRDRNQTGLEYTGKPFTHSKRVG